MLNWTNTCTFWFPCRTTLLQGTAAMLNSSGTCNASRPKLCISLHCTALQRAGDINKPTQKKIDAIFRYKRGKVALDLWNKFAFQQVLVNDHCHTWMAELQWEHAIQNVKSEIHSEKGTALLTGIWWLFPLGFRIHCYQGQIQSSLFYAAFLTNVA